MPESSHSIAIAGAWGYIGRKLLDAAVGLDMTVYAFDPRPAPDDVDLRRVRRIDDPRQFYRLPADIFHLALHPEQRREGFETLLRRSGDDRLVVLVEKPMALPERPQDCQQIIDAADAASALVLYDFPERFDPLTRQISAYLSSLDQVNASKIFVQRSKDREDPSNPRNYKRMVSIQYQESVHCLAFVLHLLAALRGSLAAALADGLRVRATARPYRPPNPAAYPHQVDGYCEYELLCGGTQVDGITDFTRTAKRTKRRIVRGTADGRPFTIDAEYLEGQKRLVLDGTRQHYEPATCSYASILRTLLDWRAGKSADELRRDIYPHPRWARVTYQLSSVLWASCHRGEPISVGSLEELIGFQAGYSV